MAANNNTAYRLYLLKLRIQQRSVYVPILDPIILQQNQRNRLPPIIVNSGKKSSDSQY